MTTLKSLYRFIFALSFCSFEVLVSIEWPSSTETFLFCFVPVDPKVILVGSLSLSCDFDSFKVNFPLWFLSIIDGSISWNELTMCSSLLPLAPVYFAVPDFVSSRLWLSWPMSFLSRLLSKFCWYRLCECSGCWFVTVFRFCCLCLTCWSISSWEELWRKTDVAWWCPGVSGTSSEARAFSKASLAVLVPLPYLP